MNKNAIENLFDLRNQIGHVIYQQKEINTKVLLTMIDECINNTEYNICLILPKTPTLFITGYQIYNVVERNYIFVIKENLTNRNVGSGILEYSPLSDNYQINFKIKNYFKEIITVAKLQNMEKKMLSYAETNILPLWK